MSKWRIAPVEETEVFINEQNTISISQTDSFGEKVIVAIEPDHVGHLIRFLGEAAEELRQLRDAGSKPSHELETSGRLRAVESGNEPD